MLFSPEPAPPSPRIMIQLLSPRPSRALLATVLALFAASLPAPAQRGFPIPVLIERDASAAPSSDERPTAAMIEGWVADLSHPDLGRRDAAISQLVASGSAALAALRPACSSDDAVLALCARRAFGQIAGTSPETHDAVREQIAATAAVAERSAAIEALGDDAVHLAQRLLAEVENDGARALRADLTVRHGLAALARGSDLDGTHSRSILALGLDAVAPLADALHATRAPRELRLHALWLHASLAGAKRVPTLAPLLADKDPALRRTALSLVVADATSAHFDALALALDNGSSPERAAVAAALAPRMDTENLSQRVRNTGATGGLAAAVLGHQGSEAARDALVAAARALGEGRSGHDGDTPERAGYGEALVGALARHPHKDTTTALSDLYTSSASGTLRASVVAAMRHRMDDAGALVCMISGLFDRAPSVRMVAADALGASGRQSVTPALIVAAQRDDDRALQQRALAAVQSLHPDGPIQASVDSAPTAWTQWLRRQGPDLHRDDLPWYRGSTEGQRVIVGVRSRIQSDFFHFGDTDKVDLDKLNQAALEAMRKVAADDELDAEDRERTLLQRVLASTARPEDAIAAIGTIPLETEVSALVRLTDAAANGMMQHLGDRYSRVRPSNDPEGKVRPGWLPGLLDDADAVSNGFYAEEKDGVQRVGFVLFDSPAYYADVQVGDQLVRIGEDFAADMDKADLAKRINTEDEFVFLREGWNRPYGKRLVPVKDNPERLVTHAMLPGNLGYVRLKQFEAGCSAKIESAVKSLERQGAVGLILDLRNNPGGTVIDATNIVDLFLPEGKLICTNEYRDGVDETRDEEIRATSKGADRDTPLVVLVNGSSASASEMTSGSLQGNERAKVIGQQSFGKGIGQNGATIEGFSSDTALGRTSSVYLVYLTMMRYYLPEGRRSIHSVGVTPDIPVRERNLRGAKLDQVMRATGHKAFAAYVEDLLENQRELCVELAIGDAEDPTRYPELEAMHDKIKRWVTLGDARGLVRMELRKRLLAEADKDTFAAIVCDVQEDRTLQAALRELAATAEVDLAAIEAYQPFAR